MGRMPPGGPIKEADMRKITSFTIAAIVLGVAIIFCAWSSVVATSPERQGCSAFSP